LTRFAPPRLGVESMFLTSVVVTRRWVRLRIAQR